MQLRFIHNDLALEVIHSIGYQPPRDFQKLFPAASPLAIDLLVKMLQFDPARRITVADAICHPYIKEYHDWDVANEPVCVLGVCGDIVILFFGGCGGVCVAL